MSADVEAINERLNGLVTLLQAVGINDTDAVMNKVSKGSGSGLIGSGGAGQLNDKQIEAIIQKLQQAQAEAPQIIAALEAHAEARSIGGMKNKQEPEEEESEYSDDDDENYPMVGEGVSDEISVVSDLTTPTVVNDRHVPDEEHYRDTLPPMIIGGHGAPSMQIAAPKRKNLVNKVRPPPGGIAPPPQGRRSSISTSRPSTMGHASGGAAASRRNKHSTSTNKIESAPPSRLQKPVKKTNSGKSSVNSGEKKVKKVKKKSKEAENFSDLARDRKPRAENQWENNAAWGSFDVQPQQTQIDNDGFLVGDFDPFGTANENPFASGGGGFSSFDNASHSGFEKKTKKKEPTKLSKKAPSGTGSNRPRRSRRASLAM